MTYKAQADTDTGKPAASGGGVHARAGQSIRGNLFRGTGGRFQAGPGAQLQDRLAKLRAAMPKGPIRATGKKGKGKKGRAAKPKQTPEQRAAAKEQAEAANRAKTYSDLGLAEDAAGALDDLAAGRPVDDDGGLVKMGLAEQAKDGSYRLTAAGHAVMNAANKGDLAAAKEARGRGADSAATRTEREQAKGARQQAAAQRKAEQEKKRAGKQKKAGGGGSAKPKAPTPEETDQAKAEARTKNREAVTKKMMANDTGITTQGFSALSKLSDTGEMDKGTADVLEGMGLVDKDAQGKPRVSVQGRKLLRAADKGDYDAALDAVAAGGDRAAARKQKAGEKAGKEKAQAKEKADKEKARAADKANKEKIRVAQKERQTDRGLRSLSRGGKVGDSQLLDMEDEGLIAFGKDNKPTLTEKGKKRLAARAASAPQ